MHIAAETLDDTLLQLYPELLKQTTRIGSTRGKNVELLGVAIEIENPRARLSRSEGRGRLFSALGEFLWYFTGDNKLSFIESYISRYKVESEDGVSIYGGYGPRLFDQRGNNQIESIISLLRKRVESRRAVIQIFNAEDIASKHKEVPCTTSLQFLVRDGNVNMVTCMRSNDAYVGLPHDVFCFTMIQEFVARALGLELGKYLHFVASMHLYDDDREGAENFIDEGFQSRIDMPPMPKADPRNAIKSILTAEKKIRNGQSVDAILSGLDVYWGDLIRMLQIFFSKNDEQIKTIAGAMSFPRYRPYIESRVGRERER